MLPLLITVFLMLTTCVNLNSQDTSPPTPNPAPITVQLFMVRTDWSQGKDVQDLEPKLTDLFKDITLSDDLRANTQRAASQVLFPRKFVATYQRQGFASLFAWMKSHDVVRAKETEELPITEDDPLIGGSGRFQRFFDVDNFVSGMQPYARTTSPFVSQQYGWDWRFRSSTLSGPKSRSGSPLIQVKMSRSPQRVELLTVRDQVTRNVTSWGESNVFKFNFPSDHVAIVNGRFGLESWFGLGDLSGPWQWIPLLVLTPTSQRPPDTPDPELTTPASLVELADLRSVSPPEVAPSPHATPAKEASTPAPSAPVTVETDPASISVQLIRIRSDWSKAKDPEAAEKALQSLTDGVALPAEVRNNLLTSAPQILCPEGFIAGYRPNEYLDMLTWLKDQDLAQTHAQSKPIPWRGARNDRPNLGDHRCDLFIAEDVVPVSPTRERSDAPPFFKRTYGWLWSFQSSPSEDSTTGQPMVQVKFGLSSVVRDEPQVEDGSPLVLGGQVGGQIQCLLPADQVAIVHCFHRLDTATKEVIQKQGWEPLLVIVPTGLRVPPSSSAPQLAKPVSLQGISFDWRLWPGMMPGTQSTQGSARQRTATSTYETTKTPKPTTQLQIYILKHARAEQLAPLLQPFFPSAKLTANPSNNSLIIAATQEQFDTLEDLIKRLDTPASPQQPHTESVDTKSIETTRNDYNTKQKEAASLARSLATETDEKAAKQFRARLTRLVTEAFDLRQKLQRAELALLKQRIQLVESRLQQRETLRNEIIQRRVEALLADDTTSHSTSQTNAPTRPTESTAAHTASAAQTGPRQNTLVRIGFHNTPWEEVLQWLADTMKLELRSIGQLPQGTFSYTSPEPLSLDDVRRTIANKLKADGYTLHLVANAGHPYLRTQQTESDLAARRVHDASEEVAKWKKALVEKDRQDDKAYLATVQKRLDQAETRLANERRSIARTLNESQSKLQESQATLEATRQELETNRKLLDKGYVTQTEFDALEKHFERTRDQHETLKADTDRYRAIADLLGLTPEEIEKAKAPTGGFGQLGVSDVFGMGDPEPNNQAQAPDFISPPPQSDNKPDNPNTSPKSSAASPPE